MIWTRKADFGCCENARQWRRSDGETGHLFDDLGKKSSF